MEVVRPVPPLRFRYAREDCAPPEDRAVHCSPSTRQACLAFPVLSCSLSRKKAMRESLAFFRCCWRSEEHTSELKSLMRISYAVFCLKKKTTQNYMNTLKH